LLDHAATEIGIDQSRLGPVDGIAQGAVGYPFLPREAGERLGLEKPHPVPVIEDSV
jgi:hypothetical protein